MSGFAVIWNPDGEPVDEALLRRMQKFLSFRGPDEQRFEILGARKNVGLINAAFHTTPESHRENQPCTIDGNTWLTGHLRICARDKLLRDLRTRGLGQVGSTDAEIVLQAYQVWGRPFVNKIIGEYSFVLWDERDQRILGVRDHMGTRPLFYAQAGRNWILSNTLDCIRLHPGVSRELDDNWMLEFLANLRRANFERTAFRDIKRLSPGHVLNLTPVGGNALKYWELDIEEPIRYRAQGEYLEHFRDLAKAVISDRVGVGAVGLNMSGGLDSTSIAALMLQVIGDKTKLIVVSNFCEGLIYDDERKFAAAAADYLGISAYFRNVDGAAYDPQWWTRSLLAAEPNTGVLSQFFRAQSAQQEPASKARTWFSGHGPDDALVYGDWRPYLRWLLKTGLFVELACALRYRVETTPFAEVLSRLMFAKRSDDAAHQDKPPWLRTDDLPNGLKSGQPNISNKRRHTWHPIAVAHLRSPMWQDYFDACDPGFEGRMMEVVHPYLDVRMLKFLLSVPVVPWCHRKLLIRESMRGLLPELVLARNKAPLAEDPWVKAMVRHPFPSIAKTSALSRYVDLSKIPIGWSRDVEQNRAIKRLLALQYWLLRYEKQAITSSVA